MESRDQEMILVVLPYQTAVGQAEKIEIFVAGFRRNRDGVQVGVAHQLIHTPRNLPPRSGAASPEAVTTPETRAAPTETASAPQGGGPWFPEPTGRWRQLPGSRRYRSCPLSLEYATLVPP